MSLDSGIRKIPGDLGRFSATRKRTIHNTQTSSSAGPGFMVNGGRRKGRALESFHSEATRLHASSERISKRRSFVITCMATERSPSGRRAHFRAVPTRHTYPVWPPKEAKNTDLYLHADGQLSFSAPDAAHGKRYREYVSDPANPVPYRQRPISPTYPGGDWRTWEVADQRFVGHRPDVLSFVSQPLDHDITVTGPIAADLFASTSGSDSDFVVKLIDVYPQEAQKNDWNSEQGPKPGEYAQSLNGYELPVAMEVRRGRYLLSYEKPQPLTPGKPTEWHIPLRDRDHVFLKGHRIMVQIQSTWFPVIDRNPQKFVPSIYKASAE